MMSAACVRGSSGPTVFGSLVILLPTSMTHPQALRGSPRAVRSAPGTAPIIMPAPPDASRESIPNIPGGETGYTVVRIPGKRGFSSGRRKINTTGGTEMKNFGKWAVAVAAGLGLLIASSRPADAKPAYANAEKKSCSFCHVGKTGDKVFTDAGKFYGKNHTLKGFGEETKAPAKAASEPDRKSTRLNSSVPAPAAAAPAASEGAGAPLDKSIADAGTPCGC